MKVTQILNQIDCFGCYVEEEELNTNNGIFHLKKVYMGESAENASGCYIELFTNLIDESTDYIIRAIKAYLDQVGSVDNLIYQITQVSFEDFSSPTHTENVCKKIKSIIRALEV